MRFLFINTFLPDTYFILVFHLPSICGLVTFSPTQPLRTDCVTHLSPSTSLSTGAPQDCVRQVPYTNDCTTAHLTSTTIDCAYDVIVMGLIKMGDEILIGSKVTLA